ncbi:MAG: arginine--tRNA ligase [Candidatus Dadabacteria bacterium]|nr:MAG: arginine--tRNA ligase [Candidatus Dadabacteria bacterium]
MKDTLIASLSEATGLDKASVRKALTKPPDKSYGDIAFPCFMLSKKYRESPQKCALRLKDSLPLPAGISSATPEGPYLNFKFDTERLLSYVIPEILTGRFFENLKCKNKGKIIVEYSSPNIAKTFHVGHLRTTLIGHSLVELLSASGYEVISINHLGDWGTQFGFVWAGCQIWGKPDNPTVDDLVDIYIKASALKKDQEEGKASDMPPVDNMAKEYFLRLEQGEKEAVDFWKWCLDISLKYLKGLYSELGIEFDHYTGESFYRDMVPKIREKMESKGILEESEGALGVRLENPKCFVRIFAEDGRSLYISRDIAAAIYREETFHPEKILYVVAAQQSLHFQQLKGILAKMEEPVAEKIVHVAFGFVPGMKTREGGAISLRKFLDEATEKALKAYRAGVNKRPEGLDEGSIAKAVAVGATYFYFLSHTNTKDFHFSWDEALNFQGDSGPYLQYAVARINSIEERAKGEGITITTCPDFSLLREDSAHTLAVALYEFSEAFQKACSQYEPYHIALYLTDLAKTFSKAYRDLKVIGQNNKNLSQARLSLISSVKEVLRFGLKLIGVPVIERM